MSKEERAYERFLIDYYGGKIRLAGMICNQAKIKDEELTAFRVAVFTKLAGPAVYLDDTYKEWVKTHGDKAPAPPQKDVSSLQNLVTRPWKGRTISEDPKQYAEVILGQTKEYGWEFTNDLPQAIVEQLKKGPIIFGGYKFTLTENGKLVKASKHKGK